MFKSNLKLAFRSLQKDRFFSFLNLAGLAVGMAASLMIAQFVRFESGFDAQSPTADRIWRAFNQTVVENAVVTEDANTHSALGPSLKNDCPGEVEEYARLFSRGQESLVFLKNQLPVRVAGCFLTDPAFLKMFPQKALAGNLETALDAPFSLILTRKTALQFFKNADAAIGQSIKISDEPFAGLFKITAVVEDPPANVHAHFNALGSYATRYAHGHRDNWEQYWEYTYFQLAAGANPARIRQKLAEYSDFHLKNEGIRLAMQPLRDIHLSSNLTYEIEANGSGRSVRFLGTAGLLVLLIAFLNYINLTTARSMKRGREVGLRKAIGAGRGQLVRQFLMEGALLNLVALGLAVWLVFAAMPAFSSWLDRPLVLVPGFDRVFWAMAAGLWVAGVVAACFWPAVSLSGFSPMAAFRAVPFQKKGVFGLRQGLVIFQFACSTALIVTVLTVREQHVFLKNHEKGLSLDRVVTVRMPTTDWRLDSVNRPKMEAMKNEIRQVAGVLAVGGSSVVPSLGISSIEGTSNGLFSPQNPAAASPATTYFVSIEKGFFETFGIRLAAGGFYEAADEQAVGQHILMNEAARKMLGFPNAEAAIGQEIAFKRDPAHRMKIHGVVADFHIETLKEPARPTLYYCERGVRNGYLSMKIDGGDAASVMAKIQPIWQRIWPESPMDWQFLDKKFDAQYRSEAQLAEVFGLFSGLAMLVACLGLFGLAAFTAERRTKEIGVRKVLGASVASVVGLLSKDFLKLVVLATLVASPVAYFLMKKWLADFAYRVEIGWWVFGAAALAAIAVAFLTVSFQAVKGAVANPVKSLRSE